MVLMIALAGCEGQPLFESERDSKARQSLIGYWAWQDEDPAKGRVERVLTHRKADGTWTESTGLAAQNETETEPADKRGTWFVMDGVLKTRTWFIGDESIPKNSRLAFHTYTIVSYEDRRVTLQASAQNGVPGLWPRSIGTPTSRRGPERIIRQVRIERREEP